jgi:hypothetical protein
MPVPITALYAGIMGLILFALDFHVGGMRGRKKISVYDAGDREMAIAVRRQGNFIEHVPLALILLGVLEASGASALGLHLLGGGPPSHASRTRSASTTRCRTSRHGS